MLPKSKLMLGFPSIVIQLIKIFPVVSETKVQISRISSYSDTLFKIHFNIIHPFTYTSPRTKFNIISIFTGGWDMVYGVTSSWWVSRQSQWPCVGLCHRLGPVLIDMRYCYIGGTSTDRVPDGLQSGTGMSCSHKMLSGEQRGQLRAGVH